MLDQREDHYAEDDNADRNTPPKHQHVQVVCLKTEVGNALGHIERPFGIRRAGQQQAQRAQKRFSYH